MQGEGKPNLLPEQPAPISMMFQYYTDDNREVFPKDISATADPNEFWAHHITRGMKDALRDTFGCSSLKGPRTDTRIKNPTENLLLGDCMPKQGGTYWCDSTSGGQLIELGTVAGVLFCRGFTRKDNRCVGRAAARLYQQWTKSQLPIRCAYTGFMM